MTATAPAPTTPAEQLATVPEPPGARIETATVDYASNGTPLQGFVAYDAASDVRRPGVVLFHDWFGVGENTFARAQMYARLGYVAFAADVFGAGVRPDNNDDAAATAGPFYGDLTLWRARVLAGLAQLQAHPMVDGSRLAAIGYCFGGRGALELAQVSRDILGAVAVHPTLAPLSDPADVTAKLLVLAGDADPMITDDATQAFKQSVRGTTIDWQLVSYAGAMHAFSVVTANNPGFGQLYDPRADRRSWEAIRDFLAELF
jgi:dienelactone hydrolase